jgi:exonuclease III
LNLGRHGGKPATNRFSYGTAGGGGVCIYIKPAIKFISIDLAQFCDEKDIEICALKIKIAKQNILVLCIYRSPSGNFDYFINKLEKVLKFLQKVKTEFIICGDFNVNFLNSAAFAAANV